MLKVQVLDGVQFEIGTSTTYQEFIGLASVRMGLGGDTNMWFRPFNSKKWSPLFYEIEYPAFLTAAGVGIVSIKKDTGDEWMFDPDEEETNTTEEYQQKANICPYELRMGRGGVKGKEVASVNIAGPASGPESPAVGKGKVITLAEKEHLDTVQAVEAGSGPPTHPIGWREGRITVPEQAISNILLAPVQDTYNVLQEGLVFTHIALLVILLLFLRLQLLLLLFVFR